MLRILKRQSCERVGREHQDIYQSNVLDFATKQDES